MGTQLAVVIIVVVCIVIAGLGLCDKMFPDYAGSDDDEDDAA